MTRILRLMNNLTRRPLPEIASILLSVSKFLESTAQLMTGEFSWSSWMGGLRLISFTTVEITHTVQGTNEEESTAYDEALKQKRYKII